MPKRAHPDRCEFTLNVAQDGSRGFPIRKRVTQVRKLGREDPANSCVANDRVQQPRDLSRGVSL